MGEGRRRREAGLPPKGKPTPQPKGTRAWIPRQRQVSGIGRVEIDVDGTYYGIGFGRARRKLTLEEIAKVEVAERRAARENREADFERIKQAAQGVHEEKARESTERLNIYDCKSCDGITVTRDVDKGVTPFMLGCAATPGCDGLAQSRFYRVPDDCPAPTHEWYRPTSEFAAAEDRKYPGTMRHYADGGLFLRPIATTQPDAAAAYLTDRADLDAPEVSNG